MKKENAFEDTMFLIDLLKQAKEKEIKQKKVSSIIQNLKTYLAVYNFRKT